MKIRPNARLLSAIRMTPWAILPEKLAEISELVRAHSKGYRATEEELALYAGQRGPMPSQAGVVAVLPLFGTLVPRANLMTDFSGGTSLEGFTSRFRKAMADTSIGGIVIQVDSPGGSVYGVEELCERDLEGQGAEEDRRDRGHARRERWVLDRQPGRGATRQSIG